MSTDKVLQPTTRPFSFADIFDRMTPEEYAEYHKLAIEAEEPCAVCGGVILCGGCPSKHPECPCYQGHKL